MRDGDDRPVEAARETLDTSAAHIVEMCLRLVEEQHVGPLLEARGEGDELALTAGQSACRQLQLLLLETELEQRGAGAALHARPACRVPVLEQLLLAV